MVATADDYTWFPVLFPGLAEAYCLTLIRGVAPEELLSHLGAQLPPRQITGIEALTTAAYAAQTEQSDPLVFIGVTQPGDGWTLAVEPNGFAGVNAARMVPASIGTRAVSHFRNINALDEFCWFEDGVVRLCFEPLGPSQRLGTEADAHVDLMRQVGFVLGEDDDDDYDGMHTEAAFALAEELTGVRVTPDLLNASSYLCPPAPAL
jgi:Family of unknown function (DUF6461)